MDISKTTVIDTLGLGMGLWLVGYLASLVLFFTPLKGVMGWILFVVMTPVTACITYRVFKNRKNEFTYYVLVAVSWVAVAMVLDYAFIVTLFANHGYYAPDVIAYYAVIFLMPLLIGYVYGRK